MQSDELSGSLDSSSWYSCSASPSSPAACRAAACSHTRVRGVSSSSSPEADPLSTYQDPSLISPALAFVAPEQLLSLPCNELVDVYAFGVILWELHTQTPPWQHVPAPLLIYQTLQQQRKLLFDTTCPQLVIAIAVQCMCHVVSERPSIEQIMQRLSAATDADMQALPSPFQPPAQTRASSAAAPPPARTQLSAPAASVGPPSSSVAANATTAAAPSAPSSADVASRAAVSGPFSARQAAPSAAMPPPPRHATAGPFTSSVSLPAAAAPLSVATPPLPYLVSGTAPVPVPPPTLPMLHSVPAARTKLPQLTLTLPSSEERSAAAIAAGEAESLIGKSRAAPAKLSCGGAPMPAAPMDTARRQVGATSSSMTTSANEVTASELGSSSSASSATSPIDWSGSSHLIMSDVAGASTVNIASVVASAALLPRIPTIEERQLRYAKRLQRWGDAAGGAPFV